MGPSSADSAAQPSICRPSFLTVVKHASSLVLWMLAGDLAELSKKVRAILDEAGVNLRRPPEKYKRMDDADGLPVRTSEELEGLRSRAAEEMKRRTVR